MIHLILGFCLWLLVSLVWVLALMCAADGKEKHFHRRGAEAQRKIKGQSGGRIARCLHNSPGLVSTIKESNSAPVRLGGLNPRLFL